MRKRSNRIDCTWSPHLAYVVGIIATDGNLSPSGRHINVTSKDFDLVLTIRKLLGLKNKIGKKARGRSLQKHYFVLQFGETTFYEFLESVGLTRAKSKTIARVFVPDKYFPDFLRGCIDGDGTIGAVRHPESSLPQIRLRLASASPSFLSWMLTSIRRLFRINGGYIYQHPRKSWGTLSFGKSDAIKIMQLMYYKKTLPALKRKRVAAEKYIRASGATG